jgi:hypothetical protein
MMHIILKNDDWVYSNPGLGPADIGIMRSGEIKDITGGITEWVFEVIDTQLFFLAVVKYGIKFEEIDNNDAH